MKKLLNATLKLKIWKDNHGQELTEYALMGGFLAAASGVVLPQVAVDISNILTAVTAILTGTGSQSAPGA